MTAKPRAEVWELPEPRFPLRLPSPTSACDPPGLGYWVGVVTEVQWNVTVLLPPLLSLIFLFCHLFILQLRANLRNLPSFGVCW